MAFAPATYNYWHGQINPLIFLLLALAYRAYTRDREIVTGLLVGLAAGIKIAPVVLVLLLLRRHWWRGTAALLATGATDNEIADILALSPATVQTHVRNAKTKLGARTRAQAVALAIAHGMIVPR